MTSQDTLALFQSGRFAELASLETSEERSGNALPENRVLAAQALVYTGNLARAKTILNSLEKAETSVKAQVQSVSGLIAKREGRFDLAIRCFQQAIHTANGTGDILAKTWAQLHLFRLLIDGEVPNVLFPMLRNLRQAVAQLGNPHLSAYLHASVAVLEGQTGHPEESLRHLGLARVLIARHPNAWLQQMVEVTASCNAYLGTRMGAARQHSQEVRRLGKLTGDAPSSVVVDINEAYAATIAGRFRSAHATLVSVRDRGSISAQLAALETLARLYLALNRLDECEATLATLFKTSQGLNATRLYPARWAAATNAKLLLRTNRARNALDYIRQEQQRANEVADLPLSALLLVLEAEALALLGMRGEATARLVKAAEVDTTNPDIQGYYYLASSRALGDASLLAVDMRERALRVWHDHGNICAIVETTSEGQLPLDIADRSAPATPARVAGPKPDHHVAIRLLDHVATAIEIAHRPEMLGKELGELIRYLGCDSHIRVVIESQADPESKNVASSGSGLGSCSLTYDEVAVPEVNLLTACLSRIARHIAAGERRRQEESARTAAWPASDGTAGAIFVDEQTVSLLAAAKRVAAINVSVLVTGETGTGKEVIARAIHEGSSRASKPFVPFNCSACPKEMFDAQLFGHRRGAFTGATEHSPGVIRAATGGTLFLDEIGETPFEIQPKLLRFLESGEIHPIGEPRPLATDVRVIAATNANLDVLVSNGTFREDLFYRLNIVHLHIPPLRERRVEIPPMSRHYLAKYGDEYSKGRLRLADETVELLLLYRWPGNIRQLANEMRRMAVLAERDAILKPEHLSFEIASQKAASGSVRPFNTDEVVVRLDQPMASAVEHLERAMVEHALRLSGGRVEETARKLGLSRKGLYLKRQRFSQDHVHSSSIL